MKLARPLQLSSGVVPAGAACRPVEGQEKLAAVFRSRDRPFDVACGLLSSPAVKLDDGRVVFVTRESVDAWPETDPSIAAVGRGLLRLCKRACGDVLRASVRQSRFTDTDIDGARVGVLSCLVRGAGRVRVYVREGEALAVVGAELASGRSRAWPVSGDPVAAVHAALDWLRSATSDEAERPAVLG